MNGYFDKKSSEETSKNPKGSLYIEVKNLPEFQQLIEEVKKEADQLQKTINQLNSFELKIDFNVNQTNSLKS